jgi:Coenzyme PQQ synthesis protein D (PqqD)
MGGGGRYRPRGEDIAAKVIDGEAVIINLSSGIYYSLDGTGALTWALLEHGHTVAETAAELATRYDVEAERAGADVSALLDQLLAEDLLTAATGVAAPSPVEADPTPPGAYATPVIERYSDMGDLLALDPPMPGLTEVPWQSPRE